MKYISISLIAITLLVASACQDQLDVENPNSPTFSTLRNEEGLMNFAMGGVYTMQTKYSGPGSFWNGVSGFHELMGDAVGVEGAQIGSNQIGCPDQVILDDGTSVLSPQPPNSQKNFIRDRNVAVYTNNNPLFYEWAIMYTLNNSANIILSLVDDVELSGNEAAVETKISVLKAWSFFWKGFAYSRIGSIYYAGIINNDPIATNSNYVSKEDILMEAESNFAQASSLLSNITSTDNVYNETLRKIIPDFCQTGKGKIPTPEMWKRHINTLRARNILVNNKIGSITPAQWNEILSLTENGIQTSDNVFTIRSNTTGDLMNAGGGNVPARTGNGRFFQVSERLIQDFRTGDQRLTNNFVQTTAWIGSPARGNSFNTRWQLINGGSGIPGVAILLNRNVNAYEVYIAGFYEENELMKAEANIYLGKVEEGLATVDNIRALQGAGLAPVSGNGLPQHQAVAELYSERRVALAFRGFSFYDARRYNVITTGRTGAVVVDFSGTVNTNATIHYNFLDYWDVPDNELSFNPPSSGSAPVINPD